MQVTVAKEELERVVSRCQGVADKKGTMAVLGSVLLEVDGTDRLRIAATDLLLAVNGRVSAQVERGGAVALGARELLERVKNMPAGQLAISSTDGATTTLRAVAAARRYTLGGMTAEEFPSLPQPDERAVWLSLPPDVLERLLARTHFSISTDETRTHLNSALFEWSGDRLRVVTTDGHRLSKAEARVEGGSAASTMLIPLKGVTELRRLCDEARSRGDGEAIRVCQSGPCAFFQVAGFQFSVKLVDATFPPYQQVIPDISGQSVRAPRNLLRDALKAMNVAANERTGGVKLTLGEGKMRFESESPEAGAGFDEIAIEYDGPELVIGFNARYFLDVLAAMEGEDEVVLGITGELDPAVLRPGTESPTSSYLAVVMPMRI